MIDKIQKLLFTQIDASVVSLFRIVFGCFMVYQMMYYFQIDYTYQFMAGPQLLFSYPGLSFMQPLPLGILKIVHVALLLAAVLIAIGLWYRYAITFFFIGFTYFSFIDITLYNNHIYLIALLAFVMIFIDADRKYSISARRTKTHPILKIPAWNQYLLVFLIALPYFYGGIAKLSSNWLDTNLVSIMVDASGASTLSNLFSKEVLVGFLKYGGIVYDLGIVFLLLFKRTRLLGILLVIIFNYTNHSLLFDDIGIFPFLMICSTILFFNAEKVNDFIQSFKNKEKANKVSKKEAKRLRKLSKKTASASEIVAQPTEQLFTRTAKQTWVTVCLGVFVLFHLLFPFRYILVTNNPEWSGQGSRFAWRMKMQAKEVISFNMTIKDNATGATGPIEAKTFLSTNQSMHLLEEPYNVIQFAKFLKPKIEKEYNIKDPSIMADVVVRFNGLPPQPLISPAVDLTQVNERAFAKHEWVVPLRKESSQ